METYTAASVYKSKDKSGNTHLRHICRSDPIMHMWVFANGGSDAQWCIYSQNET
jgi:hypothetical protein